MFDEILDLPAHPLIVHAAVVFVPLLVAAALAYVLVPFVRGWMVWALAGLAVVAPLVVWYATTAGYRLRNRLASQGMGEETLGKIDEHSDFGEQTLWAVAILAGVALAFVGLTTYRERRTTAGEGAKAPAGRGGGSMVLTILLGLAVVFFAGASAYYVYKTGESGARTVWGS